MKKFFTVMVKSVLLTAIFAFFAYAIYGVADRYTQVRNFQSKYFRVDKLRNQLTKVKRAKGWAFLTNNDVKRLSMIETQLKGEFNIKSFGKTLNDYKTFIKRRGNLKSFDAPEKVIADDLNKFLGWLEQKNFKSRFLVKEVITSFEGARGEFSSKKVSSYKDISFSLNDLLEKFRRVNLDEESRQYAIGVLSGLVSKLNFMIGKLNAFELYGPTFGDLERKVATTVNSIGDFLSVINAEVRYHTAIAMNFAFSLVGGFIAFMFMLYLSGRRDRSAEVAEIKRELEKRAEIAQAQVQAQAPAPAVASNTYSKESRFLKAIKETATVASALMNENDDIVWASQSFYSLLCLKPSSKLNWKTLTESHIFISSGAYHVKDSVKLKARPEEDYQLKTRAVESIKNYRVVEIVPMLHYELELEKSIQMFKQYKDVERPPLYEASEVFEDLISDMSFLFQATKTEVSLGDCKPIYVAFEKERVKRSLKTLLNGLSLYLNNAMGRSAVTFSYRKIKDCAHFYVEIPGAQIGRVTQPMTFNGKTYPSFGSYLTQAEDTLEKYEGEIKLVNRTQKKTQSTVAIVEVILREDPSSYIDVEQLEKKRRVKRAVGVATKTKEKVAQQ